MGRSLGVADSTADIDGGVIRGATINNCVIGATTAVAGTFTTLTATASAVLGNAAADTIAFYGATPVAQRGYSSAVHASSAASVSASFGATQLAILQELQNTMVALGIWATA